MNVQLAQAKIRPEHVSDVRAAAAKVFTAIEAAQFEGVRFAWLVLDDGATFVVVAHTEDGARNPIPGLPEYQQLQDDLKTWLAEPPERQDLSVIGSYRLF
jgi:UDP-N-acetylmuramyl pentapeptide synthase